MQNLLSPVGVSKQKGLPGLLRASMGVSPSTGRMFGPNLPRLESGPWEEAAANLLTANQSGVESDTTGFVAVGSATIARITSWSWQGLASLQVSGANNQSTAYAGVTGGISLTLGYTFTASCYVKNPGVNPITVTISIGGGGSTAYTIPAGAVARISATWTATSTTTTTIRLTEATGQTFYADGFQYEQKGYASPWLLGGTSRPAIYNSGALLIEEQGQNLMPYSDPTTLANLSVALQVSITSGVADFLRGGVAFANNSVMRAAYEAPAIAPSTSYVISALVRMDDGGAPSVGVSTVAGDFSLVIADGLATTDVAVRDLGGGLYRVSASRVTLSNMSSQHCGVIKYTGQSARGFKVSGFDVKPGTYLTSHNPTSGTAATRAAETFQIPTAGILSPTQGAIGFWFYADSVVRRQVANQFNRLFNLNRGNGQNGIMVYHVPTLAKWTLEIRDDAGVGISASTDDTYTPDGWHLCVARWRAAGADLLYDGVARASLVTPSLPTSLGDMFLGSAAAGNLQINSRFAALWCTTDFPSDAQIAAFYASGEPFPTAWNLTYKQDFRRRGSGLIVP